MLRSPLSCTVRGCGLLLEASERQLICARGHAYDVARSGYVNLLQPQDRKSMAAGDAREVVEARARLLAYGVGRTTLDAVVSRAAALDLGTPAVVIDLGAGSGDALGTLATLRTITGIGIDLSTAAADHAARRFPALTWVVANADRRLPLLDRSVDLILSLYGRRHPAECERVLTGDGYLLVAVPAEHDVRELRATVLGEAVARDRAEQVVREHEARFALCDRWTTAEQHVLDRERLRDLLRVAYRGARAREKPRAEALDTLAVTLASDVLLFRRSRAG